MKLQKNILLAGGLLIVSLLIVVVWIAAFNISSITEETNKEILQLSLTDKVKEIEVKYNILKESGLMGIPAYVENTQKELTEEYKDFTFRKTGYIFVIDSNNKFVFHKVLKKGDESPIPETVNKMLAQKSGILKYTYNGDKKLASFHYFEEWDWVIAIGISESELFASRTKFLILVLTISVIALVVSILILNYLVSKLVVKPIKQTVGIINSISSDVVNGQLDSRAAPEMVSTDFREIVDSTNNLIDTFVGPIVLVAEYIDRISKGSMPPKIEDEYHGDFNEIKNNLNQAIDSIQALIDDAQFLTDAAKHEDFNSRASEGRHNGAFREIIHGVHTTLDIIVAKMFWYEQILDSIPFLVSVTDDDMNWTFINKAVTDATGLRKKDVVGTKCSNWGTEICNTEDCAIKQFNKGNLTAAFTDNSKGIDYKATSNDLIDASGKRIGYIEVIQDVTKENHISAYDAEGVEKLAKNLKKLALGDISVNTELTPPNQYTKEKYEQYTEINSNLILVRDSLNNLIQDAHGMVKNIVNGQLSERVDANKHKGAFSAVVMGLNQLTDAFVTPISQTADYIDKISNGIIPGKITDDYKGDFNNTKNNLNTLIDNLNMFIDDMGRLYKEQSAGDIEYFIDLNKFKGVYREMADGVNNSVKLMIDAILKMLKVVESYSDGDFEPVLERLPGKQKVANDYFDGLRNNLISISGELKTLIESVKNGELDHRGETGKFNNDWKEIVQGINELINAVVNPIKEAMHVMEQFARKNMTVRVKNNYKGQMNDFKQNINNAGDQLENALSQVDLAVDQISSAANEIASGSQSLAEGTSEQASSLEEVASSLEQMNSLTLNNADNAKQGANLSELAIGNVSKGNDAMEKMNIAMDAINKSAEETGKIIKTIDEIAFQTNLLALNAAVEAAHAGEAGKGFAVVAEEVKNLALRSAEAARNTNELIEESLKNSEEGGKIVSEVTSSFDDIKKSFEKVNSIVKEISAASDEQSDGISQVNTAITELNKMTQRNAANAEESASAAEELNSQSNELKGMVNEFNLTQNAGRKKSGNMRNERRLLNRPNQKQLKKPDNMYELSPDKILPLDDDSFEDF